MLKHILWILYDSVWFECYDWFFCTKFHDLKVVTDDPFKIPPDIGNAAVETKFKLNQS